jgi:hypothetical protein
VVPGPMAMGGIAGGFDVLTGIPLAELTRWKPTPAPLRMQAPRRRTTRAR